MVPKGISSALFRLSTQARKVPLCYYANSVLIVMGFFSSFRSYTNLSYRGLIPARVGFFSRGKIRSRNDWLSPFLSILLFSISGTIRPFKLKFPLSKNWTRIRTREKNCSNRLQH
uniref:Uncharacterized protein n=1 Tax=Cacopsylla melanoneura TaxID=428564 RepID=A0A8D9BB15_9HEMI